MQIKVRAKSPKTKALEIKTAKCQGGLRQMGVALMLLAVTLGLGTRVLAVFQYVTFDVGPDPDQIRDAFAVMKIWQGGFPTLGPKAYGDGLGGFSVLPLYYYLFFPFTLLGNAPAIQAFPNAFFSCLSIPLFILLVYRLLEGVCSPKRLFLSGLSGFWYSLLFGDIFVSNFQWNPSSIPFFFMGFALLYDIQMKNISAWRIQIPAWIGSGIFLAILMSLHASATFVMPVVYTIISLRFLFKVFKQEGISSRLLLPGLGGLAATIALTPYWIGELRSNFSNTRKLLQAGLSASESSESHENTFFLLEIVKRLSGAALQGLSTVRQAYFWDASILYLVISLVAIALITSVAFSRFKGNQNIWLFLLSTWGLLLLAAASLDPGETVFYYKILALPAPIVLTAVALAYANLPGKRAIAYSLAIAIFITLSCLNNLYRDTQFMAAKYGPERLMNTREIAQVIEKLPTGAKICDPRIERKRDALNQYNYIDTYITQKQIETVSDCRADTYIIHPKRILSLSGNFLNDGNYRDTYFLERNTTASIELWPILKTVKNEAMTRSARLVMETQTAYVYLLSE